MGRANVAAVIAETKTWPDEDRLALVEKLLTPELRLRLALEHARSFVKVRDERQIDRAVDAAVRRGRSARTRRS